MRTEARIHSKPWTVLLKFQGKRPAILPNAVNCSIDEALSGVPVGMTTFATGAGLIEMPDVRPIKFVNDKLMVSLPPRYIEFATEAAIDG